MPPRGVKSPKRKRQYSHIKASAKKRGMGEGRAEEMAARTVNKQRRQAGQTKKARTSSGSSSAKTSRKRSTSGRSRKTSRKASRTTSRKTARKSSRKTSRRSR